MIQAPLPVGFEHVKVADLWQDGRGWLLTSIQQYIGAEKCLELAAVVVDNITGSKDRLAWGETENGRFTVASAYAMLTRDILPRPDMGEFYKRVWRVIAPERIRVFLWLVSHRVIMTNSERLRRHLSSTDLCQVCRGGAETIIHVLRDCPAMEGIWQRLIPEGRRPSFFTEPLLQWLYSNLVDVTASDRTPWATTFAIGVWWAWKWRCQNVFGGNKLCRDRTQFVRDRANEVLMAKIGGEVQVTGSREGEIMVRWELPHIGWYKLNTDGASRGNPGSAAAGGVIRNGDGEWCRGFSLNIGRCSATLAELWGAYYGLCFAWEQGISQLELEVDSELVVGFLRTGIGDSHPLSFLVRLCHGLLSKDWIVRVSHVYREANRLADGLANYAFTLPLGLHSFDIIPVVVDSLWKDDLDGLAFARNIRM